MSLNKKAPLSIDVVVVGGGIGGLACAYSLGKSGHRIRVLESNSDLHRLSGGIRIPPNLSKILEEWGLGDELSKMQKCRRSSFLSLKTGELLGCLEWQEDVIQETGGDFYLAHHADLHRLLCKLALSVGATISTGAKVSSITIQRNNGERPRITLEDGTHLTADLVIGADGSRSLVREAVNCSSTETIDTGLSFFTITIPAAKLLTEPELAKWVNQPEWPIWMGDSRTVLGYPIREGSEYCVHILWPNRDLFNQDDVDVKEGWDVIVPTNIVNFEGYNPAVQKLFNMAPTALRTKYTLKQHPDDWVDETGRIVLIGDAAHPFMPCTIHGASLAVEDAAVLGALMTRLRTQSQVPQLTEALQDLRQERCQRVINSELNNAALVTLPPGPEQLARDTAFRASLQARAWGESELRGQWDEIGETFGYNAREAADDWWATWGVLTDKNMARPEQNLIFGITKVEIQYG